MTKAINVDNEDGILSPEKTCAINPETTVIRNPEYAHSFILPFRIGSNKTTTPMIFANANSTLK